MRPKMIQSQIPRYLWIEGIDGSGKTTLAYNLAAALAARGHKVYSTKYPSESPIGLLIRRALGEPDRSVEKAQMLVLLFAADRVQQWVADVEPALERGDVVICDRGMVSSWVYQVLEVGKGDGEETVETVGSLWLQEINKYSVWPDLVLAVDTDPSVAWGRINKRRAEKECFDQLETQREFARMYEQISIGDYSNVVTVIGHHHEKRVTADALKICTDRGL